MVCDRRGLAIDLALGYKLYLGDGGGESFTHYVTTLRRRYDHHVVAEARHIVDGWNLNDFSTTIYDLDTNPDMADALDVPYRSPVLALTD